MKCGSLKSALLLAQISVKQTVKLLCDLRLHKCLRVFSCCVRCLGSDLIMDHWGRNGWHLISTAWKAGSLISLWLSVELYGWVLDGVLLNMSCHLFQIEGIIYKVQCPSGNKAITIPVVIELHLFLASKQTSTVPEDLITVQVCYLSRICIVRKKNESNTSVSFIYRKHHGSVFYARVKLSILT